MRIARIIEYFPPHIGGMERHGLILSQEQIKLGHEVDVFIGYGSDRSGSTQIEADQRGNNNLLYEDVTYKIRGACFKIWKQFRGGFNEKLIERALTNELVNVGLKVENQKRQDIIYNDQKIGTQIFDIVVNEEILIELKCIPFLTRESKNQFWTYLKNSPYKLGLLINFGNKLEIERRIFDGARFPHESAINPHRSASMSIYKMPLQFLPLYSKARRFWFNFWAMRQVIKLHKKNPFDIVHLHGDFIEAYFGGKLSKKLGIPAVLTIHAGLNKRLLKPRNASYFENISKVICVSEEIAGDLGKIGMPKEKITVISSGIYLIEFANVDKNKIFELRSQYGKPILVSVGVLRISKGHTYLIEAYKQLKQKYGSLSLIIIGSGPEENKLKHVAKNLDRVHFLGRQNHGKIVEYLKAADIFVLPSIDLPQDREGTPTSIMEAMAAGLPVVITKVGGSPYLIKDGVNGLLVNPKSAEELEEAIMKLINNPDIAQKMRAQNLEDIKQKDWPIITKKIDEIYNSVL